MAVVVAAAAAVGTDDTDLDVARPYLGRATFHITAVDGVSYGVTPLRMARHRTDVIRSAGPTQDPECLGRTYGI